MPERPPTSERIRQVPMVAARVRLDGRDARPRRESWPITTDKMGGQSPAEHVASKRASHAQHSMFVVSMGRYTADARRFVAQVGMTLVDGDELLRIISTGLDGEALELPAPKAGASPVCPACGAEMVRRTARRGPHAGQDFLGCTAFPACRATVPIPDEAGVAL